MTNYERKTVHTSADIRAIADAAGSYFFSRNTMRAFASRLLAPVRALDGAEAVAGRRYLFITSDRFGDDVPRTYSVRLLRLATVRDDRAAVDFEVIERYETEALARAGMRAFAADLV